MGCCASAPPGDGAAAKDEDQDTRPPQTPSLHGRSTPDIYPTEEPMSPRQDDDDETNPLASPDLAPPTDANLFGGDRDQSLRDVKQGFRRRIREWLDGLPNAAGSPMRSPKVAYDTPPPVATGSPSEDTRSPT